MNKFETSTISITPENKQEINPDKLSFDELRGAVESAKNTFRKTENGYENVNGDVVTVRERNGVYIIYRISDNLSDIHIKATTDANLTKACANKEDMMEKLQKVIEKTGGRIIK
jgi:hypothetical protein